MADDDLTYEPRLIATWEGGRYFISTVGSAFQTSLGEMVKDMGPPETVEYRAANEKCIVMCGDRVKHWG
jgi:hypothetical protein